MITIAGVADMDGPTAERISEILVESFPADERDEPEDVIANIVSGRRQGVVVRDSTAVVGFASLLALAGTDAVLLEYLAVGALDRSRGVGGQLLDRVVRDLEAAEPRRAGLLLEVEPPASALGDERVIRERRIRFYERHGAMVVPGTASYRVPRTHGAGTLPYVLMWRPFRGGAALTGVRLRDAVAAVLEQCYGLGPDEQLVRDVLRDIPR